MPARQPSLSSRNAGFIPLGGGRPSREMSENGIPLTTVRSAASTGNRKATMKTADSFDSAGPEKEKGAGFLHRHRGRRRKAGEQRLGRQGTGDPEDSARLNYMGRLYDKIVGFSVITRYLVYVAPVAILLAVPLIALPLTGHKDDIRVGTNRNEDGKVVKHGPTLFNLFLWIEITWLTLWAGKIVAWLLPKLFMFLIGIVSVGTRKYATVLANLQIPLSLFFWALATWLTFQNLFKRSNQGGISWTNTLTTILGATFVSSAILLVEKALVQLIGVSYHQRSFANRIKASKHDVYLLGLLYDASRTLFPMYCREFADEDYVINDSIELMLRNKTGKSKSGAATPMRLIGDVGRIGGKVTSAFGTIAHEITGKKVFNPNSAHSIVLEALEKLGPSEALARRIWLSFVLEGKDSLSLEDVQEVLGPAYKDEAEEAFYAIDSDGNGDISLDEMVRKVIDIAKERKAIGEGMKDIGQALSAFDKVLLFVVLLLVIFVFLAFFNSSFITTLATAGTALLSLSFIFAVTTQEFLGSCIFLFVKHPYDVGDKVSINDIELIVERISLLYSVFKRTDNARTVQTPNIVLNNLWIDNVSRSKAMYESISVNVSFDTTFEDIELLRLEMEKFVRDPENSRDFMRDFSIGLSSVGDLDKLQLSISIQHKSNWHNGDVKALRRSKFMCALALALKKVPIYGPGGGGDALGGPANPSYSVSVSDEFASKSREEAAKGREEARMVPTKKPADDQEAVAHERKAAADFNTRPPVPEFGQWDARDDLTLGSQDPSDETQRERDLEAVRNDLIKRQSTRGRRRAGESLPSRSASNAGASLSQAQSGSAHGQHPVEQMEPFDEEAQTGLGTYPSNQSAGGQGPSSGYLQPTPSQRARGQGWSRPSPSPSNRY